MVFGNQSFAIKILLLFSIGLVLTACVNGSKTEESRDIVGQLIDSAVQGVEYRCGNTIDYTDENGTFSCAILPVSFYLGKISLGEITQLSSDKKVFPQDIAKVDRSDLNNSEVMKLALLFQSLDNDQNPSNGIKIESNLTQLFNEEFTVSDVNVSTLKKKLLDKKSNLVFKEENEVREHLRSSVGIDNNTTNSETNTTNGSTNDSNASANNPATNNTNSSDTAETNNTSSSDENNETNASNSSGDTSDTTNSTNTENNQSNSSETGITADTIAPNAPTLTTVPKFTNQNSVVVEVNGEVNSILFVNSINSGGLGSNGKLSATLDTSGEDGQKDFNLTLKDTSGNESAVLSIGIQKDTIAPAQNATANDVTTDDTTPPLSGNLPSGSDDSNTTNYIIKIKIDNESYLATNNKNGTWSLADDTIETLAIGTYDVNITVTDEANNSSSTYLSAKVIIDNTGFLIDSALEGIRYVSGAYSGYTDKDGLFKYDKGAGVAFYVGDESSGISLGSAIEKVDPHNSQRRIITIFDLAGTQDENNTRVINMGKFLQSLDADNDVSNGITIDDRTKESIVLLGLKNRIDFDMNVDEFHTHNDIYELFNDLAGHFGEHRGLVETEDAKAHMVAVRDNKLATKSYAVEKVIGEKEEIKVYEGIFQSIGGVVEGLEYRSGNQFGRTDASGTFKYEEGKQVKFYIYQLELGVTEGKAVITPADLVPATSFNHPKPRNIIRLLNAFDAPNSSHILIDEAVREALEKYRSQIDINLPDGRGDAELNIPAGVDEFGAQFDDFEIGKEILDEITLLRGQI